MSPGLARRVWFRQTEPQRTPHDRLMFDALRDWFFGLGAAYGVDPLVFGAIYVGAIPFFFLSLAWLGKNVRAGRSPVLPILAAGVCFVSAYLYLLVAGRNVPAWVYGFVALLVAFGAWSTARSIRSTITEATAEADGADDGR